MVFPSWVARSVVVAMLAFSLTASDALAKRGEGGRGGKGGDGGRSASRSGGGGGGRSFSGGGGGGGGRSISGGGDRGGASKSRSFAPQRRESFSGGKGGGRGQASRGGDTVGRGRSFGSGDGGGSSLSRSFTRQSQPSLGTAGRSRASRGDGESLSRAVRSMNQGSSGGNALSRRSGGETQALGRSFVGGRRSYRPTQRDSLGGVPSIAGSDRSSAGRSLDRSQVNRTFSNDGGAANVRSQVNRGPDRAVGRAAWEQALGNIQAGRGGEKNDARRRNFGQADSPILGQQLGRSNEGGGERIGSRRGQDQIGRARSSAGGATNDQVRNFLSLRERGADRSGRLGEADGRGSRLGREGRGERRNDKAVTGDVGEVNIGDANRITDGNRGDGNRARNANRGDGEGRRNRRDGFGDVDDRPEGIVGNTDTRRGDGRRGELRDGDGKGRRWRGGELGKGDHRDWSGRWRDGKRFDVAHRIRDDWRHRDWNDHHDVPFHGDWWKSHGRRHHHHHHHWGLAGWWDLWGWYGLRHHQPYYWWNWCSAPRLRTWFVYDWATPYYWDYGQGEYIHCYNNVIYVNGRWFEPAPVYYERTIGLAESAPQIPPEQAAQVEWLPLGVFVVSRDGVVDNNVLVQLAVTKEGVIGGTVLNQATGETFDISGNVDKQSQRAAWTYVDENGKKIAMETSIFNLTQPESTALLQNGPADMQVVQLVRLEEPQADAAGVAAGVGAAAPGANAAQPQVAAPGAELPAPAGQP